MRGTGMRGTGAARPGAVLAATAALLLSGCSGSGGGRVGTTAASALMQALTHVSDTAATRHDLEFGQPAATWALMGKAAKGPYLRAFGYGLGPLADDDAAAPGALGVAPHTAQWAVMAGDPPTSGVLLDGLDLSSTGTHLASLGGTASGSTYRFRADRQTSTSDKLANGLPDGYSSWFDLMDVDQKTRQLRFGPSTAALDEVRATSHTLADDTSYQAVAGCLGAPLAAEIVDRVPAAQGRPAAGATAGVKVVGAGVRSASGHTVELLCVVTDNDRDAAAAADAIRTALRSGKSAASNQPWTSLLTGASVTTSGNVVSVTAHPVGAAAGVLLSALTRADLPGLVGGR